MGKKQFIFLFIGIIILMFLTLVLKTIFADQASNFNISCGAFFLSTFCLVSYKNALKPTEFWGTKNFTKFYYEKKGKLDKYQNLCKVCLIITISIGTLKLFSGIIQIVYNYLFK